MLPGCLGADSLLVKIYVWPIESTIKQIAIATYEAFIAAFICSFIYFNLGGTSLTVF